MLRPSESIEIIDMKITDTDEGNDKINHTNVVEKRLLLTIKRMIGTDLR
jgi:hypothetical protein